MSRKSNWTPKKIAVLKKLWNQGKTAAVIAKALDDEFSRNAVIEKARRLNLQKRGSPLPIKKLKCATFYITDKKSKAITHSKEAKTIYGEGKSLMELGANECKWPVGNPNEKGFMFCGAKTKTGKVYCEGHCKVAYVDPPKKDEREPKEMQQREKLTMWEKIL